MASANINRVLDKVGIHKNATVNLELPERLVSVAMGARLTISGLFRIFKHPVGSTIKIFAGGYLLQRGITGHCQVYSTLGKESVEPVSVDIKYTIAVNKSRQEVYDFWRSLDNLPLFMSHLEYIEVTDNTRSHWEVKTPGQMPNLRWDAEIIKDIPGSLIAWQSLPDAMIETSGEVQFDDAHIEGATIVKIAIRYAPPAGGIGAGIAKLLNPMFENMVREDLVNFKAYIEKAAPFNTANHYDAPEVTIITVEGESNI